MRAWKGHGGKLRRMVFSPNGRVLATSAGMSKFVWLWDAATGEQLAKLNTADSGRVQGLAFSITGKFLAATNDSRSARIWWMGPPIEMADHLDTITWMTEAIAFLPESDCLTAWTYGGLRLWNRPGPTVSDPPRPPDQEVRVLGNPFLSVAVLRSTPDSSRLMLVGSAVVVLRSPDLSEVRRYAIPDSQIAYDAAVSPDGRWLAVACGAKNHVLDLHTHEWLPKVLPHKWGARAVAFTPDGRQLLSAGVDGLVRFWDTNNWQELRQFDFGIGKLKVAAISADGTLAAAGSSTGRIVVWDVDQ